MAEPSIRLDRSKPFGTCHGERTSDDPYYRVHFWQGGKFGKDIVLLPFDSNGELIPDDGKIAPYQGVGLDQKGNKVMVEYQPLYNELQRKYLKARMDRLTASASRTTSQEPVIEDEDEHADGLGASSPEDDVNFEQWLRGEVRYPPGLIRTAMKKRYHLVQNDISEIVRDLVLEHKLVPEDEVCADLARALKAKAAA
jgi:hypothetical protein